MTPTLILHRRVIFATLALLLAQLAAGCATSTATPRDSTARPAAMAVTLEWRFAIEAGPNTEHVTFTCLIPQTIARRQHVVDLTFTPPPATRWIDGGNEYARFELARPARRSMITVAAKLELLRCDLSTLAASPSGEPPPNASTIAERLIPERMIESNAPSIVRLAASVPEGTPVETIRNIFDATLASLKRSEYHADDRGAAAALASGDGDCSEFSDLFVALCRARGVPAFVPEGYIVTPVKPDDTPKHAWAEAYIEGVGWVPFDPFHTAWGSATFATLSPTRIILSTRRNDPVLENYHHWFYRYWGDPVRVRDAMIVKEVGAIAAPPATRPAAAR